MRPLRPFPPAFSRAGALAGALALACMGGGAFAAAQQPAPAASAPTPAPTDTAAPLFNSPSNIKARQVVAQAIAALGGPAFLRADDWTGMGRLYTFGTTGQLDNPGTIFWSFLRFPDAERIEVGKKRDDVIIYNGDRGWEVTYRGVRALSAKVLGQYRQVRDHAVTLILRRWAADPRTVMQDRGVSLAETQPLEEVDFHTASGAAASVFFDVATHLPMRVAWRTTDPLTGLALQESVTYGNYQFFDGVNTPMIRQRFSGERRVEQIYYQTVHYGPLANALFSPPPPGRKR